MFCSNLQNDAAVISKMNLDAPQGLILDIDLDFFSTMNPFKSLYKNADLYESLKVLYWFESPTSTETQVSDAIIVFLCLRTFSGCWVICKVSLNRKC